MTLYTDFLAKYGPDELYHPSEEEMVEIRKAEQIEFEERDKEYKERLFGNSLLNCVIKCSICDAEVFVPRDGSYLYYGTYKCNCPNGHSLNGEPFNDIIFCCGCKQYANGFYDYDSGGCEPCECKKHPKYDGLKSFPFKNGCREIEWMSEDIEKQYKKLAQELEKYGKR